MNSLPTTIGPVEFTEDNMLFCKLAARHPCLPPINAPAKLGPVELTGESVRLWGSDATKFNPLVYAIKAAPIPVAPQGDVLPMPISLLPSTSFIPREYQIHLCSQRCLACGTLHEWSRAYAFNSITARLGSGKPISNLVPVDHFSYNVPIKLLRAPPRTIPSCHECVGQTDLSHLPRPMDTDEYKRVISAYQNPGNITTPQTAKPKIASSAINGKAKAKPTIDDL